MVMIAVIPGSYTHFIPVHTFVENGCQYALAVDDSTPYRKLLLLEFTKRRGAVPLITSITRDELRAVLTAPVADTVWKHFRRTVSPRPVLPTPSKVDVDPTKMALVTSVDVDHEAVLAFSYMPNIAFITRISFTELLATEQPQKVEQVLIDGVMRPGIIMDAFIRDPWSVMETLWPYHASNLHQEVHVFSWCTTAGQEQTTTLIPDQGRALLITQDGSRFSGRNTVSFIESFPWDDVWGILEERVRQLDLSGLTRLSFAHRVDERIFCLDCLCIIHSQEAPALIMVKQYHVLPGRLAVIFKSHRGNPIPYNGDLASLIADPLPFIAEHVIAGSIQR
jgi:hypothetical protein